MPSWLALSRIWRLRHFREHFRAQRFSLAQSHMHTLKDECALITSCWLRDVGQMAGSQDTIRITKTSIVDFNASILHGLYDSYLLVQLIWLFSCQLMRNSITSRWGSRGLTNACDISLRSTWRWGLITFISNKRSNIKSSESHHSNARASSVLVLSSTKLRPEASTGVRIYCTRVHLYTAEPK